MEAGNPEQELEQGFLETEEQELMQGFLEQENRNKYEIPRTGEQE